jgi:predicted nucleic acid-binding protein
MVIVDTSVIIDHLRQRGSFSMYDGLLKDLSLADIAVSTITVQELYAGQSMRRPSAARLLEQLIVPLNILEYTFETARTAGTIMRDVKPTPTFADAAIAATAIGANATLMTLNRKDFVSIPGLRLWENQRP